MYSQQTLCAKWMAKNDLGDGKYMLTVYDGYNTFKQVSCDSEEDGKLLRVVKHNIAFKTRDSRERYIKQKNMFPIAVGNTYGPIISRRETK